MRLLIVEDNRALLKSLRKGLQEEGFTVDAADDGEEGLFLAEHNEYDVVILDLLLPKLDGLKLLQALRRADIQTHVLVLTALDAVDETVRGLNTGADDYMTKPFRFEELLARVRALLRRKYQKKDPRLVVADLEIDTVARNVRRRGKDVPLRPKEYALLEFLAHHAGEVVPRSMIWEHLYDWQDESISNTIDVFISRLRKKIDRPGLPPLIHTVRGAGYQLKGG
ncbi:MAG: response regulator transcription factor [Candidatus Aminicenantes bacterium]|nr:response regulator transcription factor [Candidatus Aminicenantes bacterium]